MSLLTEKKAKQKDLSDYLSLSPNIFTEWKAGRNNSYMKHLPKIAEFFGVSVDYILGISNISKIQK
jgi:transcriptional regulator with XRE-family HTH domain